MARPDSRDVFMRCLVAFYGESAVGSVGQHTNPADIPRRLGRAAEFQVEWERWQAIGRAERELADAAKAAATTKFSEYF
jgi:hypothetical protein